ncbi:MAG: hypothetical protein AB7F35_29130 [Acetobacteraceae bacterium]
MADFPALDFALQVPEMWVAVGPVPRATALDGSISGFFALASVAFVVWVVCTDCLLDAALAGERISGTEKITDDPSKRA